MNKLFFRLFFILTLLSFPANPTGINPLPEAQAVISSTQVFTEDFTNFDYKRYVSNATWNIASGELSLEKFDSVDQKYPDITTISNNQFILVWSDDREGMYQYYAQKIDANGNRMWATDQRVNIDTPGKSYTTPRCSADSQGNVYVTWADDRSGTLNIYAQKLDSDGNQLWANDMRVNKLNDRALTQPTIAVDSSNRPIIAWRSKETGSNVYAQRLSLAGIPQWTNDVQVNQNLTNTPVNYIDEAVIKTNKTGGIAISWFSHDALNLNSVALRVQRMGNDGSRAWTVEPVIGATEAINTTPHQVIDLDDSYNIYTAWWIESEIALQKVDSTGSLIWSIPKILTGLKGSTREILSLEITANSKLLISWDQQLGIASLSGEVLVSAPIQFELEGYNASYSPTRLALGVDGGIYAAWSRESIYTSLSHDVFVRKLVLNPDPTFPWPVEASVNDHNGSVVANEPRLASANGNLYFAWNDLRNDDWSLFLNRLDSNGKLLWPNGILITSPGSSLGGSGWFDLAAFSNGDAVVATVTNGPLLIQTVDAQGNKLVSTYVATMGIDPRIAVDDQDNLILAWNDWNKYKVMKFSRDLTRLWGPMVVGTYEDGSGMMSAMSNALDVACDHNGNIIMVWQDTRHQTYPSSDLYMQKLDASGIPQWGDGVDVDSGFTWYSAALVVQVDLANHIYVSWRDPWNRIYLRRLSGNGTFDWVTPSFLGEGNRSAIAINGTDSYVNYTWKDNSPLLQAYSYNQSLIWPTPISLGRGSSSNGPALLSFNNGVYAAWQQSNRQIYLQKTNWTGIVQWVNPVNIAIPNILYRDTGGAESQTVDATPDPITQATLTADYQLNSGELMFYLSNNGGTDWVPATPGIAQIFTSTGSDLRWKAMLVADPLWSRTPAINSLRIEYSSQPANSDAYEPDDACSQARPIALNGAVQSHNFHRADDADWVWLDVIQGKTYVIQTSQTEANADTSFSSYRDCAQVAFGSGENPYEHGARFTFTATYTGRVYIEVRNQTPPATNEFTGYAISTRLASSSPVVVIVAGHMDNLALQTNIDHSADLAYRTFVNSGVPKANIRYFGLKPARDVDHNGLNDDIAGLPEPAAIRTAIQNWAPSRGVSLGVPFFLYMVDHGYYDQFLANGTPGKITASDLDLWLSNLEATSGTDQINVIIEACHSGSFIDQTSQGPGDISGHNRVVITSTASDLNAFPSLEGAFFSDAFWPALGANIDLMTAFERAKQAVQTNGLSQQPWLDDNGDGVSNALDGALARSRGLSAAFGNSAPVIDWIKVASKPQESGVLQAQVRDDFGVARVWVQIFEPGFVEPPPSTDATIPALNAPVLDLVADGPQSFRKSYAFNKIGLYRLVFYAKDSEDNVASPRVIFIQTGKPVFVPVIKK